MEILIPILAVTIIGLICGVGLAVASSVMAVKEDSRFAEIRERREKIVQDTDYIHDIIADGNRRANAIAHETLCEVREAMGMVY